MAWQLSRIRGVIHATYGPNPCSPLAPWLAPHHHPTCGTKVLLARLNSCIQEQVQLSLQSRRTRMLETVSRKRHRSAVITANVSGRKSPLIARLSELPLFWRHAASAAGVAGVDEFLRHLGRSVAEASVALTEAAEAAREQLREARLVIHAAIDARFDDLDVQVNAAEAAKAAALDRELVTVDAVLERWRAESTAFNATLEELSDSELETRHATLTSRLDDLELQLQGLPTAALEPPIVGLAANTPALLATIAGFGRVIAPQAVTASDLSLQSAPSFAQQGTTLLLRLSLGTPHSAQSSEEVELALDRLVGRAEVVAKFEAPGLDARALLGSVACDAARRSLLVSLPIPAKSSDGDCTGTVVLSTVTVAGQPVAGLPFSLPVQEGKQTSLGLEEGADPESDFTCVSFDGRSVSPSISGDDGLIFRNFDADYEPRCRCAMRRHGPPSLTSESPEL